MASGVALLHRERQCEEGVSAGRRRQLDHRFYLVMALALSAGVFAGFHAKLLCEISFPAFGRLLHGVNLITLALALCFYLAGPLYDWLIRGSVQRAYQWGVPLLIATMPPFAVVASHAPAWRYFTAHWLL